MTSAEPKGFALVEIMLTLAVTGILMAAVYNLYLNTQQAAVQQEEVVELQQNLRVAMDQLTREIRMAGFLVFRTHPPLAAAPQHPTESSKLILHTGCPSGDSAPLIAEVRFENGGPQTFPLAGATMVDLFEADDQVRLVRPAEQLQPIEKLFSVTSVNRTARTVTLEVDEESAEATYLPGDLVLRGSSTYPGTVAFYLEDNELFRKYSDGSAQRVTAKKVSGTTLINGLTGLSLAYIMDDGSIGDSVSGPELANIRAVRVSITGLAKGRSGDKVRTLAGTVSLRNRSVE